MKTLRHYFISDDLDDLEAFEERLESTGVTPIQFHVLTLDDNAVATHGHLHAVQSILRKDVIHSAEVGALLGIILALLILLAASLFPLIGLLISPGSHSDDEPALYRRDGRPATGADADRQRARLSASLREYEARALATRTTPESPLDEGVADQLRALGYAVPDDEER